VIDGSCGGPLVRNLDRALASRWATAACGGFAFTLVWFVWGSLAKVAVGNDESAYVLQAKIFASGRLVAPARPLPEFFQQFHVFVEPVLAAKYPPGHELLLAPGIWLGLPGLMPALLVAITAAILFSVTRRLTNGATAALAVFLASTSDIALRFNASYFSEITTAALFLAAWWSLFNYWQSGRRRWLTLCSVAVAWGAITRPFTMLAFVLPTAICALVAMQRHRTWRDFAPSWAVALPILAILPIWNARVVGNWRTMPQSEYARLYIPSDRLGFGASESSPGAQLTAEEQAAEQVVRRLHSGYSAAQVPSAAEARAGNIIRGSWSYGGLPGLAVPFAFALLPIGITRIVVGTLLCVFGAYLAYAHDPTWTLYYLEMQAPIAFLTAVGFFAVAHRLAGVFASHLPSLSSRRNAIHRVLFLVAAVWLATPAGKRIATYRHAHAEQRVYRERFQRTLAALPAPSIVFVRYAPGHGEERLIENVPDLSSARTWIVHDRGVENARLLALAPNRVAYLFHEALHRDSVDFRIEPIASTQSEDRSNRPTVYRPH
jgi:hypothetical protein